MTAANAHTPGPWQVDNDGHVHPKYWRGEPNTRGLALIAQVSPWDGASQDDRDALIAEAKANARLIASAPALLAALQAFVAEWDNTYDAEVGENGLWRSNQPMDLRVIEQARAAIAQAQKGA